MEFSHFVRLIAIGLQARIPLHITGFPGVGKTEFTKSLEGASRAPASSARSSSSSARFASHRTSAAFPCRRRTACGSCPWPGLAMRKRLAEEGYLVIVFLDELTTVPPTTQAAMLRLLTENVCGELQLPDYEPGRAASCISAPATRWSGRRADRKSRRRWPIACGMASSRWTTRPGAR